ncbi:formylglycine-generating enzyme family protein [Lignipirellula cremea]|uniref:Serine/threonine-protein kinase pkn1 n=1 Tax=Lignipirellula cremea TaxID=2528010 RepID=A0A518DLJ6_9BACT|nr:formylglycine-generating enzyme family protein [Lignipirellula cremea]QDU92707.1 Serine/threonine-protein kinase pkn1 [Lignipirellula cremea]
MREKRDARQPWCLLYCVVAAGVWLAAGERCAPAQVLPVALPAGQIENSLGMRLTRIEAGAFQMGSPQDEPGRSPQEPRRRVHIARPFYLGVHEVTQQQYHALMDHNPSTFSPHGAYKERIQGINAQDLPVDSVSWDDAVEFCRRLSEEPAEKRAGRSYRLPTEVEWEYACRAGTETIWSFGNEVAVLSRHAVHRAARTHPVGAHLPNRWGLHDMHGNLWEWCADEYELDLSRADPEVRLQNRWKWRVIRGGSWYSPIASTRSATRRGDPQQVREEDTGFRVVMEIRQPAD